MRRIVVRLRRFPEPERAFDPNQPRVPAGSPEGGQFSSEGGLSFGAGGTNGQGGPAVPLTQDQIDKRLGIARDVATVVGVDPASISYGGEGGIFEVGGVHFKAAGQYSNTTGQITIFQDGMESDLDTMEIASHETQHAIYHNVMEDYQAETSLLIQQGSDPNEPIPIKGSGELKPEYAKDFPTYAAIEPYIELRRDELEKKDGVSPYSEAYWKGYKDNTVPFDLAVNETLAEIGRRVVTDFKRPSDKPIPKVWRDFYTTMRGVYAAMIAGEVYEPG